MRVRSLVATFSILAGMVLIPASIAGQAPKPAPAVQPAKAAAPSQPPKASAGGQSSKSLPRTPDGKPDIQGTFTFRTITPLQRPAALANKATLTPEEAAKFEAEENLRLNRDTYDPEKGQPSAGYPPRSQGGVLSYNDFWYERGNKITEDQRTSLIIDPPDGRIPYAPRRPGAARAASGLPESYEDLSLVDRCYYGFNSGPPMISGTYNNNVQIVQTPDYVVIFNEMVHDARIVPTDGRPHGTQARWTGDSVGRWEGDTLVVETVNFRRETSLPGSTATTKVVERFTRIDADTLNYEFTISDPNAYTKPWTAVEPLQKIDELIYEYACHEGNYGLRGVLSGARFQEKEAKEAATKK